MFHGFSAWFDRPEVASCAAEGFNSLSGLRGEMRREGCNKSRKAARNAARRKSPASHGFGLRPKEQNVTRASWPAECDFSDFSAFVCAWINPLHVPVPIKSSDGLFLTVRYNWFDLTQQQHRATKAIQQFAWPASPLSGTPCLSFFFATLVYDSLQNPTLLSFRSF